MCHTFVAGKPKANVPNPPNEWDVGKLRIYLAAQPWEGSSTLAMNVYEWFLGLFTKGHKSFECFCVQLEPFALFAHSWQISPLLPLSVSYMQTRTHRHTLDHPVTEPPLVSQGDLWEEAGFVKRRLPPGGCHNCICMPGILSMAYYKKPPKNKPIGVRGFAHPKLALCL